MLVFLLFILTTLQPVWSAAPKPFAFGAVRFEANQGQADRAALYFARARGQHVYFNVRDVVFDPSEGVPVRMSFAGASHARWTPVSAPADTISYFVGNDPKRWVKAAPVYHRIAWRGVYPGIDAVFYNRDGHVEYDLVLAPGADPALVRLRFTGASSIHTTPAGEIEIKAGGATIRQHAPEIYQQDAHGKRRKIFGRFVAAANGEFRLQLGKYEKTRPLIVDPVLEASTYWGGENDDEITAVGESYVAGNTRSAGFPATAGARRRSRDIFFTSLSQLANMSFVGTVIAGGSGDEELAGVVIQATGTVTVHLAGTTNSRDFSTGSPTPPVYKGGASDGFVLELFAQGGSFPSLTTRLFRYIGGSGEDRIHAIQPYLNGVLIAGVTDSPDLDTSGGQRTPGGGTDAFFGYLDRSSVVPLSYLGGSGNDVAYAIQPDIATQSFFIAGETRSADFPLADTTLRGPSDAFLTQIRGPAPRITDPAALDAVAGHRIGGSGEDSIRALARYTPVLGGFSVQRLGIAGITTSPDLPVRDAAQSALGGASDGFAGVWLPASSSFVWLTYLGGSDADGATSASLNSIGDLSVGGWTKSPDLPVTAALQPKTGGGQDGLFALFDEAGTPRHVTYFGGAGDDRIDAVATLTTGGSRAGGSTTSGNLPLQQATQPEYAAKSDGFYADIGSDYLSGPSLIILPKDGATLLSLRPAHHDASPAITYRTSDPSRVRLSFAGRAFNEFTASAEEGVRLEALTDTGEVDITATATGMATKTIRVRLYPAVLVLRASANTYMWLSPDVASLALRAIDPSTSQFAGDPSYSFRHGAFPSIQWASSNPDVIAIGPPRLIDPASVELQLNRPGQAAITVTVPGWRVVGDQPFLITVGRPTVAPIAPIRLGQYLQAYLPIQFVGATRTPFTRYRGTLTARSEDPSRLLVSESSLSRGRPQVSIALSGRTPELHAQALAAGGEVRVILSSPEVEGEVPITIQLEPSVLRWGTHGTGNQSSQVLPEFSLSQGSQNTPVLILQGESGGIASSSPLAPPIILRFANSDPTVVALNRLTVTMADQNFRLRGLNPGTSQLSLSVSPETIRPENSTITVNVTPPQTGVITTVRQLDMGKDLQTEIRLRTAQPGAPISISSTDPSSILLSGNSQTTGTPSMNLNASQSNDASVFVQSLKDQGTTTLRIRTEGLPDAEIQVTHLPSGIALSQPAQTSVRVAMHPLDEVTSTPLIAQTLRPGVTAEVRLRSEGSPLSLSRDSLVLNSATQSGSIGFAAIAPGAETTLIAEAAGFTRSTRDRVRLRGPEPAVSLTPIRLRRDTVGRLQFVSTSFETNVTSSDPSKLLVSLTPSGTPASSVRLPPGTGTVLLHALAESGEATVRQEAAGRLHQQVRVLFTPLVVRYGDVSLAPGQTVELRASLVSMLRPGAVPFRVSLRAADPAIARVNPSSFDWSPETPELPVLRVTGLASGTTTITAEGPESLYFDSFSVTVFQAVPLLTLGETTLGKNSQAAYTQAFGALFSNGTIFSVSSSDPSRLLLSRSASALGAGAVSVSVQPGRSETQPFYLQARGQEGQVSLRFQTEGSQPQTIVVRIVNSWVSCTTGGFRTILLIAGISSAATCSLQTTEPAQGPGFIEPPQLLPDAGLIPLRLRSSDPSIFTVTPENAPFLSGTQVYQLRGVAEGTATLVIDQPEGFGPAPFAPPVNVSLPAMRSNCTELTLGPDTQRTCDVAFDNPAVTVTAESSHPALATVSNSPGQPGTPRTTLTSTRFTIQQVARHGTSEVTLRAPGYSELIIPVVAAETQLRWALSPPVLNLRTGTTGIVQLQLPAPARAGSDLSASVTATPSGIVAIEPSVLRFNADQPEVNLTIRALAPGSAVLNVAAPGNIAVPVIPLTVSVTP